MPYPKEPVVMPEHFRGFPELSPRQCPADCSDCAASCPFGAISCLDGLSLDMGKCLFCADCGAVDKGLVRFTRDYRLATSSRAELVIKADSPRQMARPLEQKRLSLFSRSLKLREVSAGGCNACEADTNVLATIGWDLGRFGVQFVASPRHADGIWVTGPVTENMREAMLMTYRGDSFSKNSCCLWGMCHQRWSVSRVCCGRQWRGSPSPGRSIYPRMSAPSGDHTRRNTQDS